MMRKKSRLAASICLSVMALALMIPRGFAFHYETDPPSLSPQIEVWDNYFSPYVFSAKAGDTVKWVPKESGDYDNRTYLDSGHIVRTYAGDDTFESHVMKTSGVTDPDRSYSRTFSGGTVLYACPLHSRIFEDGYCEGMCGIVTDEPVATPPPPVITTPTFGQEFQVAGQGWVTDAVRVTLSGTGKKWTRIDLIEGGTVLARARVRADGTWTLFRHLPVGAHNLVLRSWDLTETRTAESTTQVVVAPPPVADHTVTLDAATWRLTPKVLRATPGQTVRWVRTPQARDWRPAGYGGDQIFDPPPAPLMPRGGSGMVEPSVPPKFYGATFTGGIALYHIWASVTPSGVCSGACGAVTDRPEVPPSAPTISAPSPGASVMGPSVTFSGTSEPWTVVSIMEGTTVRGSALANGSGQWSITTSLSRGWHQVTSKATNIFDQTTPGGSLDVKVLVPPMPPEYPTTTRGPERGEISLSWSPPWDNDQTISSYRVYRSSTGYSDFTLVADVGMQRTFVDRGLGDSATRWYRITAVNEAGEGEPSWRKSGTSPTPPAAITDVRVSGSFAWKDSRVMWNPPDSGGLPITAYRIYREVWPIVRPDSRSMPLIAEVPATTTQYVDRHCYIGTRCFYSVTAVNVAGEGPRADMTSGYFGIQHPLFTNTTRARYLNAYVGVPPYNLYGPLACGMESSTLGVCFNNFDGARSISILVEDDRGVPVGGTISISRSLSLDPWTASQTSTPFCGSFELSNDVAQIRWIEVWVEANSPLRCASPDDLASRASQATTGTVTLSVGR